VDRRIFVSTRKGLFILKRGPKGWHISQTAFLGVPVSATMLDRRDGLTYAALAHRQFGVKLHRSEDGGKHWREIETPAFPRMKRSKNNREKPPTVSLIWCLEAAGPDMPGVLWAGTIPGALFKSDDRGASWELNKPLWQRPERVEWFGGGYDDPGVDSICIDPRDSSRLAIGVSVGGLWHSPDAGRSWTLCGEGLWAEYVPSKRRIDLRIQDPHRVVQCRMHPDVFWVQHHNGIFRSTDGLTTCREMAGVKPSHYGFAVAAHPTDPDVAWFVPMINDEARYPVNGSLVVTRTRDGGKTFEILSRGLPQQHAYDLVYRHALDVDDRGERLAMGSTSGTLWVSEDGGDEWDCVAPHLPPIYSVRFA